MYNGLIDGCGPAAAVVCCERIVHQPVDVDTIAPAISGDNGVQ